MTGRAASIQLTAARGGVLRWRPFIPRRCVLRRLRAAEEPPEPKRDPTTDPGFGLDELDPVRLGRKSRQAFDDLWTQFATLASPTKSFSERDFYQDAVFSVDPQAPKTRVLIIAAAGRTGRVVLRKLLLRGYQVRVLIRNQNVSEDMLPSRVEVVIGDIKDPETCRKAVEGVDKIVFAASSQSMDPEIYRFIFQQGLKNVLHAFMDYKWIKSKKSVTGSKKMLADFKLNDVMEAWTATVIGRLSRFEGEPEDPLPTRQLPQTEPSAQGALLGGDMNGVKQWTVDQNSFIIKKSKASNLHFKGAVNDIGCAAEIGGPVPELIAESEGVILRVRGDGNIYGVVCTLDDGTKYTARFVTKWGYSTVRIPFTLFRPDWGGSDTLDGSRITSIGLRFENRGKPAASYDGSFTRSIGRFNLEVDWIKTLPTGNSTEFVLVSCAGVPREGVPVEILKEILIAQRMGEAMIRNSGICYTIVRPTTLLDEPGGLKALVFDQGERVTESISAVDVADVSVRSLPQSVAANKTFEVAHEDSSDTESDKEAYELVAHVPDKSTNYLGAALANLQKNT